MRRFIPRALFLIFAVPALAWGQPVERVPEFQVNTHTTQQQSRPEVVMANSGDFLVVWESSQQDLSSWGSFGQLLDQDAATLGGEFQLNTFTNGIQRLPVVARDELGNFVAIWVSFLQDGDAFGIFGHRFDAAGNQLGGEFQVNSYTTGFQTQPAVAMNPLGDFVVVWESYGQDGSSYGVFGQVFDSTATPQGGEFQANSYTTFAQYKPAIDMLASGDFVVVWESFGQDGSQYGIFARRFDDSATALGPEFQANTGTAGSQGFPDVSLAPGGEFVVVWDGPDGYGYGVFAQQFDASGARSGGQIKVNPFITGEQGVPSVAARAEDFVVSWQSDPGSGYETMAQVFDGDGVRQGSSFQVNTYTTGTQAFPTVAMNPSGEFVVAWTSDTQDGSMEGIFGRRFCNRPPVHGLRVETTGGGADLQFTWDDSPNADDYAVLEDADPSGGFATTTGTTTSGVIGLTTPMPLGTTYYFVSARNDVCSPSP